MKRFAVLLFAASVSIVGCPLHAQPAGESITAIDNASIVECKFGGQVRHLGGGQYRMFSNNIQKISKLQCEAGGGEYVLMDAADPKRALNIWLPMASQGDANAQNRVGQIYEIGIGTAPDYVEAAKWYTKAADNGSRAAAINLAALYDAGQGVEKNQDLAAVLYTRPQRLSDAIAQVKAERAAAEKGKAAKSGVSDPGPKTRKGGSDTDVLDAPKDAGSNPVIVLETPYLPPRTRGAIEVAIPGESRSKDIVGRVKNKGGLASLRMNDRDVAFDRYGFFSTSLRVDPQGTKVNIVAIDTAGRRAEENFTLRPGSGTSVEVVTTSGAASTEPLRVGRFFALVIGNRRYRDKGWEELPNSESDARSVAALLERKYGFQSPKLLIDATFAQILTALNDYVKTLGPDDNLLIYYAGHGVYDLGKRGYWIPVDGAKSNNTYWIDNIRITDLLLKMNAHKVLVVADSCYAGAMTAAENGAISTIRPGLSDEEFLTANDQIAQGKTRAVMGSGLLAPVLEGGTKNHSVFARAFLDALEANTLPIEGYRLFLALEGPVVRFSLQQNFDQTPVYAVVQHAGHEGGDFIFVPKEASGGKRASAWDSLAAIDRLSDSRSAPPTGSLAELAR